MMTIYNRLRDY